MKNQCDVMVRIRKSSTPRQCLNTASCFADGKHMCAIHYHFKVLKEMKALAKKPFPKQ